MHNTDNLLTPSQNAINSSLVDKCLNASWDEYFDQLLSLSAGYQVPNCLKLLENVDLLVNQQDNLLDTSISDRLLIAGIEDKLTNKNYNFDIRILGGIDGFSSFKKLIKSDPKGLNKLLKIIPKTGIVDGWHYLQFVDTYQQWFVDNGYKQAYLFPLTRLLTMKRPDQFIPLTAQTSPIICHSLSIKALKKQDFKRYWDDVISRIQQTRWFKMHQPMDEAQIPFHRVRMALFERMAVVPIDIKENDVLNQEYATIKTVQSETKATTATTTKTNASQANNPFIRGKVSLTTKAVTKQPKKLTIAKLQTAKGNKNAATKLMSQYYFANKEKYVKVDVKKHRESIIERVISGESVEEVFDSLI